MKLRSSKSDRTRLPITGRRRLSRFAPRRGGAMVEFAVVMPVMFLLIVGSVDICNAIYLKQFITEVSYQGTMEGSRPGATEERIEAVLDSFLEARGIKNGSVSIAGLNGQAYDSLSEGEYFEVVVNGSSQPLFAGAVSNAMIDLEGRSVSARQ